MIKHHSDLALQVIVHDPARLEDDLNAAEAIARARAMEDRRNGILVTRRSSTIYTVEISREVPFGETQERRDRTDNT